MCRCRYSTAISFHQQFPSLRAGATPRPIYEGIYKSAHLGANLPLNVKSGYSPGDNDHVSQQVGDNRKESQSNAKKGQLAVLVYEIKLSLQN